MAAGDKSLVFGTIFEDEFKTYDASNTAYKGSKKDRKPKKISPNPSPVKPFTSSPLKRDFSEKIADGDLKSLTSLDWINYFSEKCSSNGYVYFSGTKRTQAKELEIIKAMMEDFTPEQIKGLIDFIWDVWDCPKITKSTMRISIFATGWIQEIYNSYVDYEKGTYRTYAQRSQQQNNVNRGFKSGETNSNVISVDDGIFI